MTRRDDPAGYRGILALAIPAMAATLADPLLSFTDTALVARLGTYPLASLQLCTDILSMLVWLFNFLSYGMTARLALLLARGQQADARRLAAQSLQLAFGIGLCLFLLLLVAAPTLLGLAGAEGRVLELGSLYLFSRAAGLPAAMLNLSAIGILRGMRDTKTTLWITVGANLLNLVLDLLLIFGAGPLPALGLVGAAIASVVAQWSAAATYLHLLGRRGVLPPLGSLFRPRLEGMASLIRVSRDLFLRTSLLLLAFLAATSTATRLGAPELAAHGIGMKLWMLVVFLIEGYEIAGQSLTGGLLGTGRMEDARRLGLRLLVLGAGTGLVFAGAFALLRDPLVGLFDPAADVLANVLGVFPLIVVLQPLNGMAFVLDGLLIGAGDTRFLARAMLFCGPPALLGAAGWALYGNGGLQAVWWGLAAMMALRFLTNMGRFLGGAWQQSMESGTHA